MEYLRNPIADPELLDFMIRTGILLLAGLAVMTLTQIANLGRMARSLGFKKFCTWIIILPCLLLIIYSGRGPFLLLVGFMMWKSTAEVIRLLRIPPFFKKIFVFNILFTAVVATLSTEHIHYLPAFYVLTTFLAAGIRDQMYDVVRQVAFAIIGSIWIGYFMAILVLLYDEPHGRTIATLLFGMVIVADTFAFLLGGIAKKTGIGKSPLARNISPNKTMAGMFGSVFGACISYMMFAIRLEHPWWAALAIIVLCGVGAAYGDLAESLVKRSAGVKDSSDLIPYHGGMMDRIDSLLFVIPVYLLVTIVTTLIQSFLPQ